MLVAFLYRRRYSPAANIDKEDTPIAAMLAGPFGATSNRRFNWGPRKPEASHARIEDHRLGRVGFHRGQGIVAHVAHGAFQGGRTAQPLSPIRERSEGRDARGRRHRHRLAGSPLGQPVVAAQFVQELDEQGKAGQASRLDASELGRGHHDAARRACTNDLFRQCARTHVEGLPEDTASTAHEAREEVDGSESQPNRIRERGEIGDAKPGVPNVRRAEGQTNCARRARVEDEVLQYSKADAR